MSAHSNFETAKTFFVSCETGKGWESVAQLCTAADAPFSAQAVGGLKDIKSIEGYLGFMVAFHKIAPGCDYDIHFEGYDEARKTAAFAATFTAKHTQELEGFPPPTNKELKATYMYSLRFNDEGKICEMSKIWNDAYTMAEVGWTTPAKNEQA